MRETLAGALSEMPIDITVIELSTEEAKKRYGHYFSSPTILVNGKDLFGDRVGAKHSSSS